MMKKLIFALVAVVLLLGTWAFISKKGEDSSDIEYRYQPAAIGDLIRSISATGQVVALTTVDVKSKAGGKVVRLAVDEGTIVKKGDLIAIIDPSDTKATYDQAQADLTSAQARAVQAQVNYRLQLAQSVTTVDDAKAALETARIRFARAKLESQRQPALTNASIKTAQATYDEAVDAKRKLEEVTIPQLRRDTQGTYDRTKAELDAAQADHVRQTELFKRGFVSQSVVDKAKSTVEGARAAFRLAEEALRTIEHSIHTNEVVANATIGRAKAGLDQARANSNDPVIGQRNVDEAAKAVRTAEINLQKAKDDRLNNSVRQLDYRAAQANTVHNKVSLANAKVQLDSTTVVAPRDGVVTLKYLEEGTIIPPGTSTFAQGTSLVQLSDVTQLYIDCPVDEADVASIRRGQKVSITAEAYKGRPINGVVTRVNPAAITASNITTVKVRVKVLPGGKVRILPGMNATCEFITLSKPNTLMVPAQAIDRANGKAVVRVKTKDKLKPATREVEIGASGNDGVEIKSGLKPGEEVVVATLDLKAMRDTQQKMLDAQQGGGLAGGNNRNGPRTLGGAGGGARGGGGGARGGGGKGGG